MPKYRYLAPTVLILSVLIAGLPAQATPQPGVTLMAPDKGACRIPDDAELLALSSETPDGHRAHESWIAMRQAQATVAALGAALAGRTEREGKGGVEEQLRRGVIGQAIDHMSQTYVAVVDPAQVDEKALQRRLEQVVTASRQPAASASPLRVRVQAGCFSAKDLLEANAVLDERRWHPAAGAATYGYYLDASSSTFHVTFGEKDAAVADALRLALGDRVEIAVGSPSRRPRLDDGQPHYGGAGIGFAQNSNICTSGFTVVRSGARGSVSAGHCFTNGQDVYSGPHYYGRAGGESGYPTWDMIRIDPNGQSFANIIHVDPCCPTTRRVTGKSVPSVGNLICASGMVTRAVCGVSVVSLNATFCDSAGCTPGLLFARKSGATVGQGGDSGAPIYSRPTGSTATIHGIEVAGDTPSDFYAEKVTTVEAHLGVTVATS